MPRSKELKIIIRGVSGSGKSTVAAFIKAALMFEGISCTCDDEDYPVKNVTERLNYFYTAGLQVSISTEQVARD